MPQMGGDSEKSEHRRIHLPNSGDRIELCRPRTGIRLQGSVYYSDHIQILVKWDDGTSQSLRPGTDEFRVLP